MRLLYGIIISTLCMNMCMCDVLSLDLINKGSYITLEPGYSLIMTIDFTFYKQISSAYLYYTDWKLLFISLTSPPTPAAAAQCSKKPDGELIALPSYFPTDPKSEASMNIFQEFKLRLYNYNSKNVMIFPQIQCTSDLFLANFSGDILIPATYEIKAPKRAVYGESNMFFIALYSSNLANYMLPFNMPQSDGLFFDQINEEIEFPSPPTYSGSPFDSTFWTSVTTILIPYIPFFSFCDGFGRHILLNEVFESERYCNLVPPEKTKVVQYFPTSGLSPTSDNCKASIQCKYEEDFEQSYKGTPWYFPDNNMAIYLSTDSISIDDFIANVNDQSGTYQSDIINNESALIKIPITSSNPGTTSQHPSKVTFNIKYNQVSSKTKRIISGSIVVSDYVDNLGIGENKYTLDIVLEPMRYDELVNYFQFNKIVYGILFIFLSLLPVLSVFIVWSFNTLISTNKYKPPLKIWKTIRIAFWPAFQGNFYGTIPSVLVVIFIYLLQRQGSLFSNSSIYYQYDAGTVTTQVEIQIQRGRTGLIFSLVGLFFIYYGSCLLIPTPTKEQEDTIKLFLQKQLQDKTNLEIKDFNEFHMPRKNSQQNDEVNPQDNDKINHFNSNNLDENNQGENDNKQNATKKRKNSEDDGEENTKLLEPNDIKDETQIHEDKDKEDPDGNSEGGEGGEENEDFEITQVFIFKRYHFFVVCLISSVVFLALLEFSYTDSFTEYLDAYIFLLFLIEAVFITILQEFILKESLLVYPISASLETIQFIMSIAAKNFLEFIKLYLIRMIAVILYRSYLDPLVANKQIYKIKFIGWLLQFQCTHRYLPHSMIQTLQRHLKPNDFEQNLKNYMGVTDQSKNLLSGSKTLEQVLNQLLTYASKMHSIFTKPLALLLILIFSQENEIPDQYSIRQTDFGNYLIFATIIIFPQMMIDVLVLNSLEVLYDIKLYDYFSYCQYKYQNRGVAWIGQNYVKDRTIDINFRSLDNMCFSQQFYFVGCVTISGILFLVLGISIMIRQKYIFFSDPVIYAVFPFLYFIIMPSQRILTWIWLKIDIWKLKVVDKAVQPLGSIEDVLNQERDSIEQIMEEDEIREHFLKCNKEWLIRNMKEFLTPESFLENNEYLLNEVYRQLLDDQKKEEKETRRQQMQQMKKDQQEGKMTEKMIQRKKDSEVNQGDVQQINALQVREDNAIYINPGTQEFGVLVKIIQIWYYRAKQVCFLRQLVSQIKQSKLLSKCQICDIDIELSVVELENINQLIAQFKVRNAARPFNKYQWIHFYEKNQRFQTMCIDCEYKKKKAYRKNNKQSNEINQENQKSTQQKRNIAFARGVSDQELKLQKKVLTFWLQSARSRIMLNNSYKYSYN